MPQHRPAVDELAQIRAEIRRLKTREAVLRSGASSPGASARNRKGASSDWGPLRSVLEDGGFWAEREAHPVTLEAERDGVEEGTVRFWVAS